MFNSFLIILLAISFFSMNVFAKTCGIITMTGNLEYPPVTWVNRNGIMIGSYIAYTQKILKDLGYQSKSMPAGNWKRAQNIVKAGKIDMLIGPWFNVDREKWLVYVRPEVSLDPAVVFVKKGDEFAYNKFSDLIGKRGVMQRGNSYGDAFDKYAKKNLTIKSVNMWQSAFKMLAIDRADYVPAGLFVGQLEIERLGLTNKIKALSVPITTDKMYIAFSKKSPCKRLATKISALIVKYTKSNLIEGLTKKYLKKYTSK